MSKLHTDERLLLLLNLVLLFTLWSVIFFLMWR